MCRAFPWWSEGILHLFQLPWWDWVLPSLVAGIRLLQFSFSSVSFLCLWTDLIEAMLLKSLYDEKLYDNDDMNSTLAN